MEHTVLGLGPYAEASFAHSCGSGAGVSALTPAPQDGPILLATVKHPIENWSLFILFFVVVVFIDKTSLPHACPTRTLYVLSKASTCRFEFNWVYSESILNHCVKLL